MLPHPKVAASQAVSLSPQSFTNPVLRKENATVYSLSSQTSLDPLKQTIDKVFASNTMRRSSSKFQKGYKRRSPKILCPPQLPVFWRALKPTYLYAGPLGEIVGEVEEGTIILEADRYRDPFYGWWFGTHVTDNGPLAWVSFNSSSHLPLGVQADTDSIWECVNADCVAIDQWPPSVSGGILMRDLSREEDLRSGSVDLCEVMRQMMGKVDGVPSDVELIDYYWSSLAVSSSKDTAQHWNHRYQVAVESFLYTDFEREQSHRDGDLVRGEEELQSSRERLESLLSEFHDTVGDLAVDFIRETQQSLESRRLHRHPTYINVFYYEDLCIRVCTDTSKLSYGGEENVYKATQNTFQSYEYLSFGAASSFCLLSVPLYALVDFAGYRLLFWAIPPLNSVDCVYSPLRSDTHADNVEFLNISLKRLARSLNLAPHLVQLDTRSEDATAVSWENDKQNAGVRTCEVLLPADTELYAGKDRRLYLLNGERALPCSAPLSLPGLGKSYPTFSHSRESNRQSRPSVLTQIAAQRTRAELILHWPRSVNPDWLVNGAYATPDVNELYKIGNFIKMDGITKVAGMLGLMLPVDVLSLPVRKCRLCARVLENELRLVVCRHDTLCCHICTHCYLARIFTALEGFQPETAVSSSANSRKEQLVRCIASGTINFGDAVEGDGRARAANALLLEPSIASLAHASGLNLRYLGFVYNRLPETSRFVMGPYLEVEMISRAAAKLLRTSLRNAVTPESARRVAQQYFVKLLNPSGYETEKFWSKELGPQIEDSFPGIVLPFSTDTLSIELMLERFTELSGIRLSRPSFTSLSSLYPLYEGKLKRSKATLSDLEMGPFIEIEAIYPRVKVYRLPSHDILETPEKPETVLSSLLEHILLFWIGFAPRDADERLQPNYLSKLDADYAKVKLLR